MSNLPDKLPNSIDRLIDSLFNPLATKLGNTAADVSDLVCGPISDFSERRRLKREINMKKYRQQIQEATSVIPPEDLKEPNPQILMQTVDQSKYCLDEEIFRKMFAQLIASAFMQSREDVMHPSFATLLSQLSPGDAYALIRISESKAIPVIRVIGKEPGTDNYTLIFSDVWESVTEFNDLSRSRRFINSLSRAGLVQISYSNRLTDPSLYDELFTDALQHLALQAYIPSKRPKVMLSMEAGYASLTQLGDDFISCVKPR